MASQSTGRSRRPRGGSRRRGGNDRPYRQNSPAKAPAKQTFWQKITAFFSPNGNPPSTPVSRSTDERPRNNNNGSSRSAEQPARSSRKPESVAVTTPRLYVGNLSFEA